MSTNDTKLTLILEFNVREKKPKASVWIIDHPVTDESSEYDDLPNVTGAHRIIGPVEIDEASRVVHSLSAALTASGIKFIEDSFADD